MQRLLLNAAAALLVGTVLASVGPLSAADQNAPPVPPKVDEGPPPESLPMEELKKPMTPRERAQMAPKRTLKNPYTDNAEAEEQGRKLYFAKSCNGCHGGGGGGGMCPPLTNTVWVYGSDDDTLFRLIALGTDDLKKEGYTRKGTEGVVGPMPGFAELIDTDQDLWKIIAWIRTTFKGGAERRNW